MKMRKSKKKNSFNQNHVIVIGLVLVVFYLFTRTRLPKKELKAKADIEEVRAPLTKQVQEVKTVKQVVETGPINAERAKGARLRRLGFHSTAANVVGDTVKLNFKFQPQKQWCKAGDLDTMKYAVSNVSDPVILISVESLDGGSSDTFYTSVWELMHGLDHKFELKNGKGKTSFGLFICLDKGKTKSCRDKVNIPQHEISKRIAESRDNLKAVTPDYLFYFQHLVLANKTLNTYATDNFTDDFRRSIEASLKKEYDLSSADFNRAWKISSVTRSLPTTVKNGKMILELPYNDSRCTGNGPQ